MPRFGLKALFVSVTLLAAGLAVLVVPLRFHDWVKNNPLVSLILVAALPGGLCGAGIGILFGKTWLGIRIGSVLWLLIGFALAVLFPATNYYLFPAVHYFQN